MRFIVSTSTLLKQLQAVSGALSNSTVLPILENFLFEIKDGNLTISATDLQTSMTTSLPVEAKENGRIAIPSRILLETLKSLPEQPVNFSVDDTTFAIEINAGDGKYKLNGENGEDFPKIPVVENASSVNLPASVLGEAINKTIFAVSNDELRPAMTGVYCQLSTSSLTFLNPQITRIFDGVSFATHRSDDSNRREFAAIHCVWPPVSPRPRLPGHRSAARQRCGRA